MEQQKANQSKNYLIWVGVAAVVLIIAFVWIGSSDKPETQETEDIDVEVNQEVIEKVNQANEALYELVRFIFENEDAISEQQQKELEDEYMRLDDLFWEINTYLEREDFDIQELNEKLEIFFRELNDFKLKVEQAVQN